MKSMVITFIILTIIVFVFDVLAHFIMSSDINILKDIIISFGVCLGIFLSERAKKNKKA